MGDAGGFEDIIEDNEKYSCVFCDKNVWNEVSSLLATEGFNIQETFGIQNIHQIICREDLKFPLRIECAPFIYVYTPPSQDDFGIDFRADGYAWLAVRGMTLIPRSNKTGFVKH